MTLLNLDARGLSGPGTDTRKPKEGVTQKYCNKVAQDRAARWGGQWECRPLPSGTSCLCSKVEEVNVFEPVDEPAPGVGWIPDLGDWYPTWDGLWNWVVGPPVEAPTPCLPLTAYTDNEAARINIVCQLCCNAIETPPLPGSGPEEEAPKDDEGWLTSLPAWEDLPTWSSVAYQLGVAILPYGDVLLSGCGMGCLNGEGSCYSQAMLQVMGLDCDAGWVPGD